MASTGGVGGSSSRSRSKGKSRMDESTYPVEQPKFSIHMENEEEEIEDIQREFEINTEESQHQHDADASKNFISDIFKIHFSKKQTSDASYFDVICNYCQQVYKYKKGGGYGTFRRHLEKHHATQIGLDRTQTQISGYKKSQTQSLFQYSDEKNKDELAKMISTMHLSFSFGEKPGFVNYCQNALNPSAKRVPRNTLKRSLIKLYRKGKRELYINFSNFNGRVSICSDIWSDHWQAHSYMGITCHWIDDDWNIQKRIIAFRIFDDRHTADNIYRMIKSILEEYRLVYKIFSIGFDNASANTASISDLKKICQPNIGGKFFHVRCACHVLNLCVQDGLKALDEFISPIRKAFSYLWGHPQIMKEWAKFCKLHNRRPKRFPKDVPTRWNSTYEMLNESYKYSDLLCTFINNRVPQIQLYPQHWEVCSKILEVLKVFNDATYTLSGVYYPTSHLFIIECINIIGTMLENEKDDFLNNAINCMKVKWLNYYKRIPQLFLVACVFDPRCKLEGLSDYLNIYYECLNINLNDINDMIDVDIIVAEVKKSINDLYSEFSSSHVSNSSQYFQSSQIQNVSTTSTSSKISMGDRILLQREKKAKRSSSGNSEFDIYLTTIFEFGDSSTGKDFPVLEWWKRHANTFPILSQMARQVFATPVSTVAVEQAFSAGSSILDEMRSSMHPESLEAQTCVDDWTKAELRQQEMDRDTNEELYDFSTTTSGTGGGRSPIEEEDTYNSD